MLLERRATPRSKSLACPVVVDVARGIACVVAGRAADLVIKVTPRRHQLALHAFHLRRAGRSEEMDQRLDFFGTLLLRQSGENIRHGRARLRLVRITDELAKV